MLGLIFYIIFLIVSLFLLYFIISIAVRDGINKSIVGQFIEKKYEFKASNNSFLDRDLDNDN